MRTNTRTRITILAAVAALALGACGDDDGDVDPPDLPDVEDPDVNDDDVDPPPDDDPAPPADDAALQVASSDLGDILVDAEGLTVYRFDEDEPGVSNCEGDCLAAWPPVAVDDDPAAADEVSGEVGTLERDDGTRQLTIDGWPLYYWAADAEPGQTSGQGVGGVWWVVAPDGSTITG